MTIAGARPVDGSTVVVFGERGGPYPYGSPMPEVGYVGKSDIFIALRVRVGPIAEDTDGKERVIVGVVAVSSDKIEYVSVDPNSLSGMAVPTPVLVHGVGTGRSEVTGLACGIPS